MQTQPISSNQSQQTPSQFSFVVQQSIRNPEHREFDDDASIIERFAAIAQQQAH